MSKEAAGTTGTSTGAPTGTRRKFHNYIFKEEHYSTLAFAKQIIPEEYHDLILCHFLTKKIFENEESKTKPDCVICTNTGYLLEFEEKRLVGSYELSSKKTLKMLPFVYYESNKSIEIFYVVHLENNVLEIVQRSPYLKRIRLENDVKNWKIDSASGSPQLKVQNNDDGDWKTISWNNENAKIPFSDGFRDMEVPLELKLELMNVQKREYGALLNAKRQFRAEKLAELTDSKQRAAPICILDCQYALHHGNIVIAVKVLHIGRVAVSDVHLVVVGSRSVKLQQRGVEKLADGAEALVLGFVTVGDIRNEINASISYEMSGTEHFMTLPPHHIKPHNIISAEVKIERFGIIELCEALLYCSQVSEIFHIKCPEQMKNVCWNLLISGLEKDLLNLQRESSEKSVWNCSGGNSELSGSYVILDKVKHTVTVCCRDEAQFGVLCIALNSKLLQGSELTPYDEAIVEQQAAGGLSCLAALRHELDWINQHYKFGLAPVPAKEYQAFYQELSKRQSVTDACFGRKTS